MELWVPSLPRSVALEVDRLAPRPAHWPSDDLLCAPVWGTPRRLDRPTFGPAVTLCGAGLGKRLMPWQQYASDVIGEYNPDTGRPFYREYRIAVPRQMGKTTLVLAKSVHRCIGFGQVQRCAYAAQTRIDAAKKMRDEYLPALRDSPVYSDWFESRESQGSESVTWLNGSTWAVQAVQPKSGHGPTVDEGLIDEAFAQQDGRTEQGMRPAMMTRQQAQLGVLSTAGKADGSSPYWEAKVLDGRARVEAGQDQGIAYFEFTAATREDPVGKDVDMLDPAVWARCMPALGYTASVETIRADVDGMLGQPDGEDEVARAYGNLWRGSGRGKSPIDGAAWARCLAEHASIVGVPVWSVDINPDQDWCTVAVAGRSTLHRDVVHVELVDHRPGPTDWALDVLRLRAGRYGRRLVVLDGAGPAAHLAPALRKAKFQVEVLQLPQLSAACMDITKEVTSSRVSHLGDTNLNTAVQGAGKRKFGDRWAFSRGASGTNITPLMAVTLARFGVVTWPSPDSVLDTIG